MLSIIDLFESTAVPNSIIPDRNKSGWKKWILPAAGLVGAGLTGLYLYNRFNQTPGSGETSTHAPFTPDAKSAAPTIKPSVSAPQPKIQIPAAVKDPIGVKPQQLSVPDSVKINDIHTSAQLGDAVPQEIPKIFQHPVEPEKIESLAVRQINDTIDQKDRDIDDLVSNALNI